MNMAAGRILLILSIAAGASQVAAAQTPQLSISSSTSTLERGDNATITVSVPAGSEPTSNLTVSFSFGGTATRGGVGLGDYQMTGSGHYYRRRKHGDSDALNVDKIRVAPRGNNHPHGQCDGVPRQQLAHPHPRTRRPSVIRHRWIDHSYRGQQYDHYCPYRKRGTRARV